MTRPALRDLEMANVERFGLGLIPSNDEIWERGRAALAEMRATPVEFGYRTTPCTQPLGDETRAYSSLADRSVQHRWIFETQFSLA